MGLNQTERITVDLHFKECAPAALTELIEAGTLDFTFYQDDQPSPGGAHRVRWEAFPPESFGILVFCPCFDQADDVRIDILNLGDDPFPATAASPYVPEKNPQPRYRSPAWEVHEILNNPDK